jgi:hypothetical protein
MSFDFGHLNRQASSRALAGFFASRAVVVAVMIVHRSFQNYDAVNPILNPPCLSTKVSAPDIPAATAALSSSSWKPD